MRPLLQSALLLLVSCDPLTEGPAERDPHRPWDTDSGEGADTATLGDTGDTGDTIVPTGEQVCYPGAEGLFDACLPVVAWAEDWGEGYDYPPPLDDDPQYAAPVRYVDLASADPALVVAPNFVLEELMAEHKGRFGVFQVHAVERLQTLRDLTGGPLQVNSGYRNVSYNAGVGGATWSRHMYGDAVDIVSDAVDLETLGELCWDQGAAYVGLYEAHVHCDWRSDPLDPAFYDVVEGRRAAAPAVQVQLRHDADGAWVADASGLDEGEPLRRWTATDAAGSVLTTTTGRRFTPPPTTRQVQVVVAGLVRATAQVD